MSQRKKESFLNENEGLLISYYNVLAEASSAGHEAKLLEKKIIKVRDLIGVKYKFLTRKNELYEAMAFLINDKIYYIYFSYLKESDDLLKNEREQFFKSLKIDNSVTVKDQIYKKVKTPFSLTSFILYVLPLIFGFVIVFLYVKYVSRKKNKL